MIARRRFVGSGAAAAVLSPLAASFVAHAAAKAPAAKFKVGVTDWNLRQTLKLDALALAKKIGFDGVQVSIGRDAKDGKLPLADPALQKAYLAESRKQKVALTSLCLDILHVNGLKSDPLGQKWIADAIPIAKAMGVKVILLPFFGKWTLETPEEMDRVGDALREVAPAAEKAKVVLGLEDTISAKDNVRIMERAKSSAVLTYYDIGNSTKNGFDVIPEIRWLGRDRICEVHIKDNPKFLGEGTIDVKGVVDALADIGFAQWSVLETDSPTKDVEADQSRNLKYVRELVTARNKKG
jgi:sugar phosphate isomerase/epimerase